MLAAERDKAWSDYTHFQARVEANLKFGGRIEVAAAAAEAAKAAAMIVAAADARTA